MNLDEATKKKVAGWIEEGMKLSQIQSKLASELNLQLTYMETRLLVDDLKLMPKDQPPPEQVKQISSQRPGQTPAQPEELPSPEEEFAEEESAAPAGAGNVSLSVDRVARPGALVSGSVTFSDGNSGSWYLDQMGRLGIAPKQQGYRPSPEDVHAFQVKLQSELAKLGF